jgi:hypothetical protein
MLAKNNEITSELAVLPGHMWRDRLSAAGMNSFSRGKN